MKQVIVVRKDLGMSPGKIAVQVAHASLKSLKSYMNNMGKGHEGVEAIDYNKNKHLLEWHSTGETKIAVWCKNMNEFEKVRKNANNAGINVSIIVDEGRTELETNTITCMALGPAENELMDTVTGKLQLIK